MTFHRGWRALVLALLAVGTALFPLATSQESPPEIALVAEPAGPPMLRLKCGVFDPLAGLPPVAPELRLSGNWDYQVVQFDGPVTPDRSEWLDSVSQVLAYLPDYAYAVRTDDRSALRAHPGVRYVGPFEPAYKLEPRLSFTNEEVELAVLCFDRLDYPVVVERLLELRAGIVRVDPLVIRVRAPGALALAIAFIPEVQWVERYNPPALSNNAASKIVKVRSQNDGPYDWGTSSLWSYNASSGQYEGYAGKNFTAAVVDTGVDGSHPAFNGKKVAYYAYGYSNWVDYYGHGTHTSGSVLGNGAYRSTSPGTPGRYAGMAPLAGLVGQIMANAGYYTWCHDALVSGAVVSSNSWGGGYAGAYDYSAASYDSLVRDSDAGAAGNQSISVVFSAGNEGAYGAGSISPPATAKNVIAVGATDDSSGNNVAGFSSRGPCDDGRLKPDLMAPGQSVTSCYANSANSYVQMSGTSMSCPVLAGAAVIVNEYHYRNYGAVPSPATVKNLLINGATPMPGQSYPGNTQGWGRLNVANSLLNTTSRRIWAEDQALPMLTGVARIYLVNVTRAAELRVSLVWTDFCATAAAARALVNDLDLSATSPDGTRYLGNVFSSGYSATNGSADNLNNVEMVRFQSARPGTWMIEVKGSNVPRYSQDFSLVVGGAFDSVTVARVDVAASNLTIDPADPAEGDTVTVTADMANAGDLPVPDLRYRISVRGEDNLTRVLDSSNLTGLGSGDGRTVRAEWVAVRGWTTVTVEADPGFSIPEDNETNNIARLEVLVRGFGVWLSCGKPSVTVMPEATGNLSVTVHNLGNAPDAFALSVEGALPPGWRAQPATERLDSPAGANLSVDVRVTPAADALAGDRADFRLRATSLGNGTYTRTIELSALADQYFGLRFSGTPELGVPPGAMATHSFWLNNTGNGPDTVELSMYGLPNGWGAYISGSLFHLQARETQRATLTVVPPASAPAGARSNMTVEAAWGPNQRSHIYLVTRVLQTAGVTLELADGPDTVDDGGTASFTIKVQNDGNGQDSVDLRAAGEDGWTFGFSERAPSIRAGDFSLVDLSVTVPPGAPAGEHIFRVRGSSAFNASAGSGLELALFVNQRHSVELGSDHTSDTVEIGNSTQFEALLENTGNGDDSFALRTEGGQVRGWRITISPSSMQLASGGSAHVLVKVRPPQDVAEGNYTFTLSGASLVSQEGKASLKFSVRIVAPPPPPPQPPPPPPPVVAPDPVAPAQRNRVVAWIEDNWQLAIMVLVAIVALASGGAYVAMRRRRQRRAGPGEAGGPPEAAAAAPAGAARAASPAPPPVPAGAFPLPPPAPARQPPVPQVPPEEPVETIVMDPPPVEPPSIPLTDRKSGPSPPAKRAVDDEIEEILARLSDVGKK
ncbi:MAG: hypothetical protein FJ149_05930 [Euryarchaeota archaeon]|nr:hypothetical protein [Euryarchaeota archaeon]